MTIVYIPLASKQFCISNWLWNMNNPKISVALASLRASLEMWSNCSRLFPQWMHTVSRLLKHRAVFFRQFCSQKPCSQCIRSFTENAQWGKTKTHKVQKGNTVNCYWNSTSKLLAVWIWFVLKEKSFEIITCNEPSAWVSVTGTCPSVTIR